MQKVKKSSCLNCGFIKPKKPVEPEKEKYCSLCDEIFKVKDAKEHKNKNLHIIKNELIKKIRELDGNDEEGKKTIDKITKSLIPKHTKGNDKNKNNME